MDRNVAIFFGIGALVVLILLLRFIWKLLSKIPPMSEKESMQHEFSKKASEPTYSSSNEKEDSFVKIISPIIFILIVLAALLAYQGKFKFHP